MRNARERRCSMRPLLAIAWCWIHLAAVATPVLAEDADTPLTPTFNWPAPASIPVTFRALKKGKTVQGGFNLVTKRNPEDDSMIVSFKDVELLSIAGELVDTPEQRAKFAPILALYSLVPSFKVSKNGELIGLVDFDWDLMLSEMRTALGREMPPSPQVHALLDQTFERMRSPQMRAQVVANIASNWKIWVEFWLNATMNEGETLVLSGTSSVFETEVEQETILRHLGSDGGCLGCVLLRAESTEEGPEFEAAMVSIMRHLGGPLTGEQKQGFEAFVADIEEFRRVTVMEAVTDLKTLKPTFVTIETKTILRVRNKPASEEIERRSWSFSWPDDAH